MKGKLFWALVVVAMLGLLIEHPPAASQQVTLEVLNPRGELPPQQGTISPAPRIADLEGKKIALVANYKAGAELFLTKIEELLKTKFPTAQILRFKMQSTQLDKNTMETIFSDIAKQCDVFVHSTGD